MDYSFDDIKNAYAQVGVHRGSVVLLKTDIRYLGAYAGKGREVLHAHLEALSQLIDFSVGTLVVSSASTFLCNTDGVFDPATTPSEMGVLTEYIRKQPDAVRSFHPFASHTALGKHAEYLCRDCCRHTYGPESPKARMLDLDTMYVSVGLEPRWTCSFIHHVEKIMAVPYRYTKEFIQPVIRNGREVREPFYMYLCYHGMDLVRARNKRFIDHYLALGYSMARAELGRGTVWGYSANDFYRSSRDFLRNNIYGWAVTPPTIRPYDKRR